MDLKLTTLDGLVFADDDSDLHSRRSGGDRKVRTHRDWGTESCARKVGSCGARRA